MLVCAAAVVVEEEEEDEKEGVLSELKGRLPLEQ
jgi:hypothetical protein